MECQKTDVDVSEKFVERQIEELEQLEDVDAVAVVGSYVRKPEGDHNDLDLLIIADKEKRKSEEIEDVVVEKFFRPLGSWKKACEEDDWWKIYLWTKNWDIRFDPENLLPEIKQKAKEVKEERLEPDKKYREEISYIIWDKLQNLDAEDVAQRRYLMNEFFNYLLYQHYILKGVPPVKSNYRVKKLQDFSGYMYKLSQDFLLASSTMKKRQVLEKIVDYVSKDLPEIGPEWED